MAAPGFEEAVQSLVAFLAALGHPRRVEWVFKEDIDVVGANIQVRVPIGGNNEFVARRAYSAALDAGLGVELRTLCGIDELVYCYVWAPKDEIDAEYALITPGELKLSIPTVLPKGSAVESFALDRVAAGPEPLVAEIPSRDEWDGSRIDGH